jgi:ATP-dependent Clp protease protease subunit
MNPLNPFAHNHPSVIDEENGRERQYDLISRLMRDRIIYIGSVIDSVTANGVITQLLYLNTKNKEKPIHIYINSPGGSVSDGLAIYDMMQWCSYAAPIHTYTLGMAASMGSLLASAGTKGHRYAMPNAKIMIHQPHLGGGGIGGQVTDIEIQAAQLVKTKEQLLGIYQVHTGQKIEFLKAKMERDCYMTPQEAIEFGLIDSILSKPA